MSRKTPPQHQLEEIEAGVRTRLGLYQQEEDAEGARVYEKLLPVVLKAKSAKDLEALV
jgi:hypothetical protein